MNPLIINFAPTGMIPTKDMTPYVPIHPSEIVKDVLHNANLGISIAHLHARDEIGRPTYRKESYAPIIEGIREQNPEIIICVSTSGRNYSEFDQRSDVLNLEGDLKPDMASLTLSSLNFPQSASVNSPQTIIRLAEKMREKGIKPELEVFDLGMINFAKYLINKDLLEPPYYFNILLGNIATAQANLNHVGLMISELPDQSIYSLAGIGDFQKVMTSLGVIIADGVRIGIEDNIWLDRSKRNWAKNEDLVKRVVAMANAYERQIAKPDELRKRLGLS